MVGLPSFVALPSCGTISSANYGTLSKLSLRSTRLSNMFCGVVKLGSGVASTCRKAVFSSSMVAPKMGAKGSWFGTPIRSLNLRDCELDGV